MLGALEAWHDGRQLPLGGPKQRALLALLILARGEVRTAERLIDELWRGEAPAAAGVSLRAYISRLRSLVGGDRLRREGGGYRLSVSAEELDAFAFERLIAAGEEALERGRPGEAEAMLSEALRLWRGEPAADVAAEVSIEDSIAHLEELHLQAVELRVEARAQLGRHVDLVAELQSLVAAHPLRETLRRQLMLALARSGRPAEALVVYERSRELLAEELGTDPGPELKELHRAILRNEFATAVAAAAPTHNLPAPATSFLGREHEVAELEALLLHQRCVAITGMGGVGKSRLAVETTRRVAGRFRDGARLVELARINDPELIASAVASGAGMSAGGSLDTLLQQLSSVEMLLVLDNCEHLAAPVAECVMQLLTSCAGIRVLATSRERLGVPGEAMQRLQPLPEALDAADFLGLSAAPAVRLFLDRTPIRIDAPDAHQLRTIAAVCRALDGLPLAIELAAARTATLPLSEIAKRLDDRFRLLVQRRAVAPPRQRTLGATMDWSYGLLSESARRTLRGLAAFAGGFTFEAVADVCFADDQAAALESLGELVDASLVTFVEDRDAPRYGNLETVRQYAADKLASSGEAAEVRSRHASFFLTLAESANLSGDAEGPQDHAAAGREQDNVRAAIEWAATTGRVDLALRLAVAMENFWVANDPTEGVRLLSRLLEAATLAAPPQRARALRALGGSLQVTGDTKAAREAYEESLQLFRAEGDARAEAAMLHRLGLICLASGEWKRARQLLLVSLAGLRQTKSPRGEAQALGGLGSVERDAGHLRRARILMSRSARMAQDIGRPWWRCWMLLNLADLESEAGELEEAERRSQEALAEGHRIGDRRVIVHALARLSVIAADTGQAKRAGRYWGIVEAQEQRPIGGWEQERAAYADRLSCRGTADFEAGLAESRAVALDDGLRLVVDRMSITARPK